MQKALLVTICITISGTARAGSLHCEYRFYGQPMANVDLELGQNGELPSAAKVSMQGRSHMESVTGETLAPGQDFHLWISKESEQNSIEMITYEVAKPQGNSVLINHHVPYGQEMWGQCSRISFLPTL